MMNQIKSISWALLLLVFHGAGSLYSQQISLDHVEFQIQPDWGKVLSQARQTGKVIFLDGYTTWCAPCRKMDKEVFTMPEVANYFNQKFINVKYDMERGEGASLKERYGVRAFPTYLFIDGNGRVVHRIVGAYTKEGEFLSYAMLSVTPGKSYVELEQRYRNGERNPDLMFSFMQALRLAGERKKAEEIVADYLALMSKDHFMDSTYWQAIKEFLNDPMSREFKILLENRDEIAAAIGAEDVDEKIYEVINNSIGNQATLDGRLEEDLLNFLRGADFPRRNELLARALAASYARQGDWYDYACTVDAMIDFHLLSGYDGALAELDAHAKKIERLALDDNLLKKALRWSEYACSKETSPSQRAHFLSTQAGLLEKLGKSAAAASAREAARLARIEAENNQNKRG